MKYLALLMIAPSVFGASTANLILRGTVPVILDLSIAAEPIAMSLPLDVSQTNTKVATLTERCNHLSGYRVTIQSTNLGKLKLNATSFVNYVLTYNNQSVNLSSAAGQTFTNTFVSAAPIDKDIKISYAGIDLENSVAGDYTDNVLFTITQN